MFDIRGLKQLCFSSTTQSSTMGWLYSVRSDLFGRNPTALTYLKCWDHQKHPCFPFSILNRGLFEPLALSGLNVCNALPYIPQAQWLSLTMEEDPTTSLFVTPHDFKGQVSKLHCQTERNLTLLYHICKSLLYLPWSRKCIIPFAFKVGSLGG